MIPILFALGWLVCGFFGYGFALGDFTKRYPWSNHFPFAFWWGLFFGPISASIAGIKGGFEFRLKPLSKEQSWQAHHSEWPLLDRKYFERNY